MAHRNEDSIGLLDQYNDGLRTPSTSQSNEMDSAVFEKKYQPYTFTSAILAPLSKPSFRPFPVLKRFVLFLLPSFFLPSSQPPKQLHPTAYLDGLRGVAAFFVFIHHMIADWFPSLSYGYGTGEHSYRLIQLPIVRVFYSGRGMVAVFFVISGYVLSYKSLRLMRNGQYASLMDCLASSVFRRSMRLYFPIIGSTFISMLLCWYGLYIQDTRGRNILPIRAETFSLQVSDWWTKVIQISNPFQSVDGYILFVPMYDAHLWTIPIEFRGSLVVFSTLVSIARLRPRPRLAVLTLINLYLLWQGHWDLFLFVSGTLIADIQFAYAAYVTSFTSPSAPLSPLPTTTSISSHRRTRTRKLLKAFLLGIVFLFSIHLLCLPDEDAAKSYGYRGIIKMTPASKIAAGTLITQRFWLSIGSFLLVLVLQFSKTLQKPFNTAFAQYLGNISYSLYLMHGPVLYTLGMAFLVKAGGNKEGGGVGGDGSLPSGYVGYFWASVFLSTVVTFWSADVFTRGVDVKSVKLARWISECLWVKE